MGLSVTGSVLAPGHLLPAWGQPDWVLLEEVPLRPGGQGDLSEGAQQEVAPCSRTDRRAGPTSREGLFPGGGGGVPDHRAP